MSTALFTHPACLRHVTPDGHPERVARLEAIYAALEGPDFAPLLRREAPLATRESLARAHYPAHLDAISRAAPTQGMVGVDPDTFMSPGTLEAAARAAGGVVAAVDAVLAGEAANAFCAVRPPGHHAERDRAMGFCFYSNAAVGALHALEAHGLSRVAIIDFDVHHGNGTEDVVAGDDRILFVSTHQWPLFPGTGGPDDARASNVLDLCLPSGAGSAEFRAALSDEALPRAERFAPELVVISAGFDAHRADPLANLGLTEEDFGWATDEICALAGRTCAGRVVSTLEGGYDLSALAASAAAHMRALMAHGAAAAER